MEFHVTLPHSGPIPQSTIVKVKMLRTFDLKHCFYPQIQVSIATRFASTVDSVCWMTVAVLSVIPESFVRI